MDSTAYRRTKEPARQSVSLADVLDFLRLDNATDVEQVEAYIRAATAMAEDYTQRAFIHQEWTLWLDAFPGGAKVIQLPRSPAVGLVSATYYDLDGVEQTLDPSLFWLDANSEPGKIVRRSGSDWPSTQDGRPDAVKIVYQCGHSETSEGVPENAKHAIRFLVSHFYENRTPITGTIQAELSLTARALLNQLKVYYL